MGMAMCLPEEDVKAATVPSQVTRLQLMTLHPAVIMELSYVHRPKALQTC